MSTCNLYEITNKIVCMLYVTLNLWSPLCSLLSQYVSIPTSHISRLQCRRRLLYWTEQIQTTLGPGGQDILQRRYLFHSSESGLREALPFLHDWACCLEQQKCLYLEVPGGSQSAASILTKVNGLQLWFMCWNISSFLKNKSERVLRGMGEVLK